MNRRSFTLQLLAIGIAGTGGGISGAVAHPQRANASSQTMPADSDDRLTVFRSPTCGCCEDWSKHMRSAGFSLEEHVTQDMDAVKQRYGVPAGLDSCHTALIGGYVIEGHVPAADVQRLLAEKPDVVGLTAPGMPMGSPGMETDQPSPPYTVFSLKADGSVAAFAKHS